MDSWLANFAAVSPQEAEAAEKAAQAAKKATEQADAPKNKRVPKKAAKMAKAAKKAVAEAEKAVKAAEESTTEFKIVCFRKCWGWLNVKEQGVMIERLFQNDDRALKGEREEDTKND